MPLDRAQTLHRLSFGHRNKRTYVLVVYVPHSEACQGIEMQVGGIAASDWGMSWGRALCYNYSL